MHPTALLLVLTPLTAQDQPTHVATTLDAGESAPVIDGVLDEPLWVAPPR